MQLVLTSFLKATSLHAKASTLNLERGKGWAGHLYCCLSQKKSHAALKRESSTGTHSPYKHQNLVPKLFWQLSHDAVLLPMRSAFSESPFIIPHCIFNNWTLSAFFQTSSGFGLKMTAARVHLSAETSYLSRGWKVSRQVMLFGSQTLQIKASFPCWSISCLWGSFPFWVRGSASVFEKWRYSKLCQRGRKTQPLTLRADWIPLQEFKGKKLNCDPERLELV